MTKIQDGERDVPPSCPPFLGSSPDARVCAFFAALPGARGHATP
jgi:hypothetical protein